MHKNLNRKGLNYIMLMTHYLPVLKETTVNGKIFKKEMLLTDRNYFSCFFALTKRFLETLNKSTRWFSLFIFNGYI